MAKPLRVIIDTNVLFEGLTRQGGAAQFIVDAWMLNLLDVRVSNAVAYEYADVLSRRLSQRRWLAVQPILKTLLEKASFVDTRYRWRPISPDPGDDHVIDCAMNSGAIVVTFNLKDFRLAKATLGLKVTTPVELAILLSGDDSV